MFNWQGKDISWEKKGLPKKKKKHVTRRLRRSCSTERREIKIELDSLIIGSDRLSDEQKKRQKTKAKTLRRTINKNYYKRFKPCPENFTALIYF